MYAAARLERRDPTSASRRRSRRWAARCSTGSSCAATRRVLDAGCGTGPRDGGAARAAAARRGRRGRRVARDGRGGARAARRRASTCASPTCRARRSRSPSTRSSRPRPSTGSPTTTGCSRACFAALKPGGRLVAQCGGEGNVAAVAGGDRRRSPSPRSPAGPGRGTSSRPEATEARLRADRLHRRRTWPQNVRVEPEDPPSTSRRSCSARSSSASRRSAATRFVDAVLAATARARRSSTCGSTSPAAGRDDRRAGPCRARADLRGVGADARPPRHPAHLLRRRLGVPAAAARLRRRRRCSRTTTAT